MWPHSLGRSHGYRGQRASPPTGPTRAGKRPCLPTAHDNHVPVCVAATGKPQRTRHPCKTPHHNGEGTIPTRHGTSTVERKALPGPTRGTAKDGEPQGVIHHPLPGDAANTDTDPRRSNSSRSKGSVTSFPKHTPLSWWKKKSRTHKRTQRRKRRTPPRAPHPLEPWLHWIRQKADPVKFRPLNSNACNFHNLLVRAQTLRKRMPCHAVRLESHIATWSRNDEMMEVKSRCIEDSILSSPKTRSTPRMNNPIERERCSSAYVQHPSAALCSAAVLQ